MTEVLLDVFNWINDTITGNFGLTIILFTFLLRVVCLPIDIYSRKGQRDYAIKTAAMKGEIDLINKAYKHDPQRQQQEIMALRKKHGIGIMPKGCFSQLLVYPLLIAFFAVFRNMAALQIRELSDLVAQYGPEHEVVTQWFNENSFLWIRNIWMPDNAISTSSIPVIRVIPFINFSDAIVPTGDYLTNNILAGGGITDPDVAVAIRANMNQLVNTGSYSGNNGWFILPVLSAVLQFFSMKITTKLNPQTAAMDAADPQAASSKKMSNTMNIIFPLLFAFFCFTSSSALAIYWVASSVIMTVFNVLIAKGLDWFDARKQPKATATVK
ncbi:MAG: membrane protein insertase YidC [Clostridia bacterium]|nr:membrane protein insertase YidC [Clostridia bacterium]